MSATQQSEAVPSLAARLGAVQVGLRGDLEVTRHLSRGVPTYIVCDPLTFQSQQLSQADYAVFVGIDSGRSLGEAFADLVAGGRMHEDDEEHFYRFVMDLHRLGFLRLPLSDNKLLYRRFKTREKMRTQEKVKGFLFLRIPLWNPNAFLDRTVRFVRPFFSRTFFVFWLLLTASAGYVAIRHWSELVEPMQGLLVARNLPLMWLTLIVLKVFHEFGHAYACKHFGGHVPEMGAFLIMFTPCAYMDASACWGFTRRRDRLIVCLGGMFVESIFASIAVFVWVATEPSLVHSLAYNVIFLASVVTALFNINPLMRFDGYYVLSDLVEIPNLRQRASEHVSATFKRIALGLRPVEVEGDWRMKGVLLTYGIAAAIYRITLLVAIIAILATKAFIVGVVLGVWMAGSTLFKTARRLVSYLWYSEETAEVRFRAVVLGVIAIVLVPAAVVSVPLPSQLHAPAIVTSESEQVLRAPASGFLVAASVEPGASVRVGESMFQLRNETLAEAVVQAEGSLRAAELRRDAFRGRDQSRVQQEEARIEFFERNLRESKERLRELAVAATLEGRVIQCLRDRDVGRYVEEGAPLATITSGAWRLRAVLSEAQIGRANVVVGDTVEFRPAGSTAHTLIGTVARIAPVGARGMDIEPLTHLGGGDIAVDPMSGAASQPYFELTIELSGVDADSTRYGMTGVVSLAAISEPLSRRLGRRVARFWNSLLRG